MISQQITEFIYEQYQPQEFYHKYLKENKKRVDGRTVDSHRNIRVSLSNNSVVLAKGGTVMIAQLKTSVEGVTYSPVTESYGKPLLKGIRVQMLSEANKFERSLARSIEKFVQDFIDWKKIERQLVEKGENEEVRAHVGEIVVKIGDSDGCLEENALLASQFLLWTASLPKIGGSETDKYCLNLQSFWFPIKYCEILDELIVDPTASEEKGSNYELTMMKNLIEGHKIVKVQKIHTRDVLPGEAVAGVERLYLTQISKLPFSIEEVQQKSQKSHKQVLTISGL